MKFNNGIQRRYESILRFSIGHFIFFFSPFLFNTYRYSLTLSLNSSYYCIYLVSEDNTDVYFIALRTYSDFSILLLRLRPVVVRPRPIRAEKAELIGRFRYIYIYFFFFAFFRLHSNIDSRSTKYLRELENSKLPLLRTNKVFHQSIYLSFEIRNLSNVSSVLFRAYLELTLIFCKKK